MNRHRAFRATVGSGADLAARQLTQFAVLLVLARLVTPAEFGTIALLAVVVALGIVAADAGLPTAVLQSSRLSDEDLDTAFWTSVALGLTLTLVGVALAAPLAAALGRPDLAGLGAVLSTAVLSSAVAQIPNALLIQRVQYRRLLLVGTVAGLSAGAAAIALATAGHGLWALAVQFVGVPTVSAVLLLVIGGYRPRWRWSRSSAARLFSLGRWVIAANLVDSLFLRTQTVVLGALFGPATLGRYQRADSTQQLAAESTSTVVSRVALPLFAAAADRPDLLRAGMGTGIRSTTAVNAPVMAILAALSGQVLLAFFGPRWEAAAPILSVLCLAGLLWPMHVLAITVLYSVGRNREVFRIDLAKKGFAVVALGVGALGGALGVAWAQVALGVVAVVVNGRAVRRAIDLGVVEQLRDAAPPLVPAAVAGVAVAVAGSAWRASPVAEVLILGAAGAALYVALALALRLRALRDLLPLFRHSTRQVAGG